MLSSPICMNDYYLFFQWWMGLLVLVASCFSTPPQSNTVAATSTQAQGVVLAITATPTLTPTVSATLTPTVMATQSMVAGPMISETTRTLSTYPLWDFLVEQPDPLYNMPVYYFNRAEFEAVNPAPVPVEYTAVVLENDYLTLTFLPELGGRLYSAVVKSTGQEIFYQNPVVKASRYGILQPPEANWWLATGGIEWAYPTQEHGYRFGIPWDYTVSQTAQGATITLSDSAPDRVSVSVEVTLPVDKPYFTIVPTLTNNGAITVPVQMWLNGAMTLGAETMSPETQFIVPVEAVIVHSRGGNGWDIPGEKESMSWPIAAGKNLRVYHQWADYLGFFIPSMQAPFIGVHNPDTNVGLVRLVEPGAVPGTKVFAFGQNFYDRSYTDNGSQYFELWGGLNTGFWPEDDIQVASGQSLSWQESWWPMAKFGPVTWANDHVALSIQDNTVALLWAQTHTAHLDIFDTAGNLLVSETVAAYPTLSQQWTVEATSFRVQISDEAGTALLNYCVSCDD